MTPNASPALFGQPGFLTDWGAAWSSRDPEALARHYTRDCTYIDAGMAQTYVGHDELKRFVRHMLRFSDDTVVEFTSLVADGSRFVAEWVWSGRALGPLQLGGRMLDATNKSYRIEGVAVCDSAEGLVSRHKDYYDVMALVAQVS